MHYPFLRAKMKDSCIFVGIICRYLRICRKSIIMREEQLKIYDELVAKCSRFERKGKTMPYTSANGHMFSLFNKANEIGIRFSKAIQKKYLEEYNTTIYKSYNSVMRGYILITKEMLEDLNNVARLLDESYDYVMSLDPK